MQRTCSGNGEVKRAFSRHFQAQQNWLFDVEPYTQSGPQTFEEVAESQRLKLAMKRAVSQMEAPRYLIDSIRSRLRK